MAQDVGVHLQEVGREFGVTTGRRRRCGWLDLVVMKHSTLINGYDALNLTKLDILDDLKEIKVAVKYTVDGKELEGFPGQSSSTFHHTYHSILIQIGLTIHSGPRCPRESRSHLRNPPRLANLHRSDQDVRRAAREHEEVCRVY